MNTDVIMAGFGGQGILMIGNLLSIAAMEEGKHVTYFPAYGVEMRGGTANCTVVISDEEIGSPVVGRPKACVIMNGPSLEKYLPMLQEGGDLVINRSLVDPAKVGRGDLRLLSIPANDIAREVVGSQQLASMVALGAYVTVAGVVRMQTLFDCLPKVISKKYEKFIPLNVNALKEGESFARHHP
ncbi:MAG: 2-oxoacid:ferredoxin oxidoreductase subunit gamma [Deltaproteobacteria bacterium RBG_19FT_COMBO_60_16]|nr:MAG: 2-oxoacid:ferredoxin oxidoreductase subunit gamma [Deltaproteobacteria bacterium RBG_16_64_85]OGP99880.1 MAG: 2-oxoacid:ferredoxin oxidoreductase subunit gamma [Deltaproteobacteria bacterium RBG_19FT_COMBO_60_16]